MKIAIQAADLDAERIDGTRIYILNLLRHFGKIDSVSDFLVYHKKDRFNPELTPPQFPNYCVKKIKFPFFWTQIRFAWETWRDKPDRLWVPFHNVPLVRRKRMKTTITIHDLAFKIFPQYFTKIDLWKINFLTDLAVRNTDQIIAISEATKQDILRFYPSVDESKIKVIYHGFDAGLFQQEYANAERMEVLERLGIFDSKFMLYVGAIQPRKNLQALVQAFNLVKKDFPEVKLVLAGGKAWLWEEIFAEIEKSPYRKDIILTGQVSGVELAILYQQALLFVFPSLYEGFGIPIIEAMAAGTPVVTSYSSSLVEVGETAAEYIDDYEKPAGIAHSLKKVLGSESLRQEMIAKGHERIKTFSWEKCAQETLEWIKS